MAGSIPAGSIDRRQHESQSNGACCEYNSNITQPRHAAGLCAMIGQKGPGRCYPGDTCYHRDDDGNRDCTQERCWVRNGKMRSTLCRAHETEKNNRQKREYLQSGGNINRNRLRRQEEEDDMMELIAFPEPSKYLELIAELCKPKIDRRTIEHKKSAHSGPLGRARLGAA